MIHNFNETGKFNCHCVTDERSAGFYAIGLSQATSRPVAVCVTSGTALLNIAPAVAEAFYQHIPLLVISADRPQQWIGQQDGQTLPQPGAFGHFVSRTIDLVEPEDGQQHWYCNRIINEALMDLNKGSCLPVHINVRISEPLFDFVMPELSEERFFTKIKASDNNSSEYQNFLNRFANCSRPMIVIGQDNNIRNYENQLKTIGSGVVIISDALSGKCGIAHYDEAVRAVCDEEEYQPDMVLYFGGNIVSKALKKFLRRKKSEQWIINSSGEVYDTFMNLMGIIESSSERVINDIELKIAGKQSATADSYVQKWKQLEADMEKRIKEYAPAFSHFAAVRLFESFLDRINEKCHVQYANSSSIRLANIFSNHFVWCNRGVNGIEGSLSAAAGMSLATDCKVFCVIGDLSFFYDQNALWNNELKGNFRILLLNNGGGSIFKRIPGLASSGAVNKIMAKHSTTADGICSQNGIGYNKAENLDELGAGIEWLINSKGSRPLLLEVLTSDEDEENVWSNYYNFLSGRR